MSQINFHGVPAGVKAKVPDMQVIAKETKATVPDMRVIAKETKATVPDMQAIAKETQGIKPFPELYEKAGQKVEQKEVEYTSPYAIHGSQKVADVNEKLSAQIAARTYAKNPPIPYN